MPLDAAQLATLKTELETDPDTLGYGPDHSTDAADADLLNARSSNYKVNNDFVETAEIRASVTFEGFDGLVTAEQSWFEWLTGGGAITVNAHLLQKLAGIPTADQSIWAVGERVAMNAAMAAVMQRDGSRAEDLFGANVFVSPSDVANARNLP